MFDGWEVQVVPDDSTVDFDAVNKCDLFVLGGGELIHPDRVGIYTPAPFKLPRYFHKLYAHTNFAFKPWIHRIKIPKAVLGCGVNAASTSELSKNVKADLAEFDYIGLRDKTSISILKDLPDLAGKVHYFPDFALALTPHPNSIERENYAVVVPTDRCTASNRGVSEVGFAEKSRHWLKNKLSSYNQAVYVAFGKEDNNDSATCRQLLNCHPNSRVADAETFEQVAGLMQRSSGVVSYRLHGLILAFMAGAKCEFYPYHWKLGRVHDSIKQYSLAALQAIQKEAGKKVSALC